MALKTDPQHKTKAQIVPITIEWNVSYPDRYTVMSRCGLCNKLIEFSISMRLRELTNDVIEHGDLTCAKCMLHMENLKRSEKENHYES